LPVLGLNFKEERLKNIVLTTQFSDFLQLLKECKGKVVPQHTIEGLWGRGDIAVIFLDFGTKRG
jgi:hypothetical protein